MRRMRTVALAACAALVLGSCGPSMESAMADVTDGLKTLNGILAGIQDVDSARSACARLEAHAGVMEAAGRTLAPEPFLSSVLLGGGALSLAGTDAQKSE